MAHPPTRRVPPLLTVLVVAAAGLWSGSPAGAQQPKSPQWSYAFDLACRKLGEREFTKETPKFGVEVFRDANNGLGVYLSQPGSLAVVGDFESVKAPLRESKAPEWTAGLDLKARKAGEQEFTNKTKTYSLEVFYDNNASNWIYLTEKGSLAVTGGKGALAPAVLKAPVWQHSMDLRCRRAGQKDWSKGTVAFGIEVYRDANTQNLIYITDTGSLAVVSGIEASAEPPKEGKAPEWLHGLDLQVRKAREKDFTKSTRKVGMEIFRDANNGCLILLTEEGNLAVLPGPKDVKAPTASPRDARLTHGLDLSCRRVGERDFTDKTRAFGVEVFREENLGLLIYICETGTIAAAPGR